MKKRNGKSPAKILPRQVTAARRQTHDVDRPFCDSAENIAILDTLVKQRRSSIQRAVDKIEGLQQPEENMRTRSTKVQKLTRELRRIKTQRAKAKKLLAGADLSFIQDHRHGQLVELVEQLRTLLGVRE